ncbi:MAG: hypothetical protein ACLR0N_19285 [Bilophila wadsworthia]
MPIELSIALDEEKLPPNLPIVIFASFRKPSATSSSTAGRPAPVSLGMDGDALRLVISDDGRAFRSRKSSPT